MRLHRGSSKDARGTAPATGNLPLSASPPTVQVEVEVVRGGRGRLVLLEVVSRTLIRELVRKAGEAPEGCIVLVGETPVPLDTPIDRTLRLTVIPTFSGG